jgi:thioesterase domain-containing protein
MSWCYMPMARHVPGDVPVYGLQSPALDGAGEVPASLGELAAASVAHIRALQPSGPYHLLGYSFGGRLAHEIAVQLQAAGQQVAALVIMDAYPPAAPPPGAPSPGGTEDPAAGPAGPGAQPAPAAGQAGQHPWQDYGGLSEEEFRRLGRIQRKNAAIARAHQPGVFRGPALLLAAAEGRPAESQAGRWTPHITGQISEVALACTHEGMARPEMMAQAWSAISAWLGPHG